MGWVTQAFIDTWKSGRHVAGAAPTQVIEVRRGNFRRDYRAWSDPLRVFIPGEDRTMPWYPIFVVDTDWVEVPSVSSVDLTQDFSQNGCKVATITLDNVGYPALTGPGGTYHAIQKGFYSPTRGDHPSTRPVPLGSPNAWYDVLTENAAIRIWWGYGPPVRDGGAMPQDGGPNGCWVFHGLVDDVDSDSTPAQMTMTARMGKTLTDQRIFGWAKSKQLLDPVTFIDRLAADNVKLVGFNPVSSTGEPRNVLDASGDSAWISQNRGSPDYTEWVEIHLPAGRYTSFTLSAAPGLEAYIGIYPRTQELQETIDGVTVSYTAPPSVDGIAVESDQWYDPDYTQVPGDNGGWGYFKKIDSTGEGVNLIDLGHEFNVGENSVLRVGFRDLNYNGDGYEAIVYTLKAHRHLYDSQADGADQIVRVDDLSDVVRCCLRWAGYTEWDVEDTGVKIKGRMIFNKASFLIDPINKACELTGFVFFIADPTNGASMGIPTFRRPAHLLRDPGAVALELTDDQTLTGLHPKRSDQSLPYIIRLRGKEATAQDGGLTLGGEKVRRIMAVYRPPWTQDNTMAGIIKHGTYYNPALRTAEEVTIGAYLIAVAAAVAAFQARASLAGMPLLELDDQVGILDEGTGTNSRLLVGSIQSHMTAGEQASWTTEVTGPLIDTLDMVAIIEAIVAEDFTTSPVIQSAQRTRRIR
jgi:hypothetical protein